MDRNYVDDGSSYANHSGRLGMQGEIALWLCQGKVLCGREMVIQLPGVCGVLRHPYNFPVLIHPVKNS